VKVVAFLVDVIDLVFVFAVDHKEYMR